MFLSWKVAHSKSSLLADCEGVRSSGRLDRRFSGVTIVPLEDRPILLFS